MPDTFWIDEYRQKATLESPIAQSGRGNKFEPVEFLYVLKQAIDALDLSREHDLLDVGCANGLLDIVLSACARTVLAIEPVDELAAIARRNLESCTNVEVKVGFASAIPASDERFDRVLVLGVLQLIGPTEIAAVFREIRRVARPGAVIFFGSVPDARHRDEYLGPYLAGVRAAAYLTAEQKAAIEARNLNAHWYGRDELRDAWRALGADATIHALSDADPNAAQRFHLRVRV